MGGEGGGIQQLRCLLRGGGNAAPAVVGRRRKLAHTHTHTLAQTHTCTHTHAHTCIGAPIESLAVIFAEVLLEKLAPCGATCVTAMVVAVASVFAKTAFHLFSTGFPVISGFHLRLEMGGVLPGTFCGGMTGRRGVKRDHSSRARSDRLGPSATRGAPSRSHGHGAEVGPTSSHGHGAKLIPTKCSSTGPPSSAPGSRTVQHESFSMVQANCCMVPHGAPDYPEVFGCRTWRSALG